MRAVLIDAGPMVALIDRSDEHHVRILQALDSILAPLVTVLPAVVEAMYLLSFSWKAQKALWEILETDRIRVLEISGAEYPKLKALMAKYRDLPMDMADAALVYAAHRENIRRILTLDQRDFSVYRLPRKGAFTLLP